MGLRLAAIGLDRAGRRRQQRRHAVVAGRRAELAGEPHIGRRADPRQHLLFFRRGRRQPGAMLADDANPAGRAAAASAAHRSMRDAGKTAHLQDGEPGRLAHAAAFVVVETHDAGAPFPEVAQRTRAQNADQQGERPDLQIARNGIEVGDVGRRRRMHAVEQVCEEARLLGKIGDVAQGNRRAARCRRRGRAGRRHRAPAARRRYQDFRRHAKCRPMQACSQTTRGKQELAGDGHPVARDQRSQHPGIARLDAVEFVRQARAHDMERAQRNDQRAQHQLRPLPARELSARGGGRATTRPGRSG